MTEKHAVEARSQERYLTGWRAVRLFLKEREIPAPMHVTYSNIADYTDWRVVPDLENVSGRLGQLRVGESRQFPAI